MLASCSPTPRTPGEGAGSTTTTTAPAHGGSPALDSHCSRRKIELPIGTVVPAPYLAAVQFVSVTTGVGLTAASISCSIGPGGGSAEPFPVFEVLSTDGGMTWRTMGSRLPRNLNPSFADAELAFSSPRQGFVEASGVLAYTSDGGRHWRVVDLGGTVTALEPDGAVVLALVSNPARHEARVLQLARDGSVRRGTPVIRVPGFLVATVHELAVVPTSGELVVAVPGGKGYYLVSARRFGSPWSPLATPCGDLRIDAVLATGGGGLVAICAGEGGMNKSPKIVTDSADAGLSWSEVATWRGPQAADRSGLPIADYLMAAIGPGDKLYLATTTEVTSSSDGGRRWSPLDTGPRGKYLPANASYGAEFDFVGRLHGWLLLQGEALLSTSDGEHWRDLARSSSRA